MKKCPTCQKTYDDNLKFCQTDGTPLVDDAPPVDPYATMVASKDEILASIPSSSSDEPKSSPFSSADDDLLDIPEDNDMGKTMVVTEAERKDMFETPSANPIPPPSFGQEDFAVEDKRSGADTLLSQPEPPKFNEPDLSPPNFGDISSSSGSSSNEPSSPFGSDSPAFNNPPPKNDFDLSKKEDNNPFNTPIPSPFGEQMPPSYNAPTTPPFEPPAFKVEEAKAEALNTPFAEEVSQGNQAVAESRWTPSPAPEQNWGNQETGQNAPPPSSGAQGENKTLAYVSLGLGILGFICCGNIVCGIPAIIVGIMARNKEAADPRTYGGSSLAMIGMVLGALSIVIFIVIVIFQLFLGGLPFLVR